MTKETEATKAPVTRDSLRQTIFDGERTKCKRAPVTFNGAKFELQQPTITEVTELNERPEASSRVAVMLIKHAYVPGTNERVFEEADYEVLASLPYTPELTAIQETMTNFLVGDDKAAEKN